MDTDKQGWFPVIAVVCLAVLGLGALMAFLPRQVASVRHNSHRAQLSSKMMVISRAMTMYASSNGGKLPDHVGRLIASGYVSGDAFVDPRNPSGVPPTYTGEARPGAVYRFGDVVVLYDPSHTLQPPGSPSVSTSSLNAILLTSAMDYDPDHRVVLLGMGYAVPVETSYFASQLATDNTSRKAAGLAEIDVKDVEALDKPMAAGATP